MGEDARRREIRSLLWAGGGGAAPGLDQVVGAMGYARVVQYYLRATFGVSSLDELGDHELVRALLFIDRLDRVTRHDG